MTGGERVYGGLASDKRRAQRRARLLEAALDLLATNGWQASTVRAICERARLTPRYFYESFEDRDALLIAVFDTILEEAGARVGNDLQGSPPGVAGLVRATIAAWMQIATEDPRKARVVFVEGFGSERLMRRRLEGMRGYAHTISELARSHDGVPARHVPAVEIAALLASGGLVQTMIEWLDGRLDCTPPDVVEAYTATCMTSLEAAMAGDL